MELLAHIALRSARWCVLLPLWTAAGCALLAPSQPPLDPEPAASTMAPAAEALPETLSETLPSTRPQVPTPAPAARVRRPHTVAIIHDGTVVGYREVAAAVAASLDPERFTPALVGLREERSGDAGLVVAVGLEAARAARARFAGRPIVFCQVFDYHELLAAPGVWGVHAMPPLELQLRAWKTAVPSVQRVGFILSAAHAVLAQEALQTAATAGIRVSHEVSSSDRETLYLFRRLATEIDGLWLFPDNRILSRTVLREIFAHAAAHDISVLVHNDALLEWGASLSVASTPADVARSVRQVLEAIIDDALPVPMTPLSELAVIASPHAAGSAAGPQTRWVLRDLD